ncbi:MAG: flagellar hook-length control protein FliK, partial [Hyphomicrobiales bacterium]|nr:flagellar hook-length control protein FliK [Hyphomicrobiales bacterium]
ILSLEVERPELGTEPARMRLIGIAPGTGERQTPVEGQGPLGRAFGPPGPTVTPAAAREPISPETEARLALRAAAPLKVGDSLEARFLGWAATATGNEARVQMESGAVTLRITADAARRAALQPGSILSLEVERPELGTEPARMRLIGIAPGTGERQTPIEGQGPLGRAIAPPGPTVTRAAAREPISPETEARLALRAAAGPIIGAALARQNGLAPLFSNLEALERAPILLPSALANAAAAALKARLPVVGDGLIVPEVLQQAVTDSGIFHEARLGHGDAAEAAFDLKSTLLILRQVLRSMVPDSAGPSAAAHGRVPPPSRDGAPVAQPQAAPTIDAVTQPVSAMLETVLKDTEAALDRLSISQFASLPSPAELQTAQSHNRWFIELPMALEGRTVMLPLEIEEDRNGARPDAAQGRLWRIRFALDVEPMGPVHAMVTMQGKLIGVFVWAEREATSQLVRSFSPDLEAALLGSDFERADIEVMTGQPQRRAPMAGQYLDRRS